MRIALAGMTRCGNFYFVMVLSVTKTEFITVCHK